MEKKEAVSSPTIPSSQDSAQEDFKWVKDKNYPSEIKNEYLKYPLDNWRKIVFDPKLNKSFIHHPGNIYESKVNKVLKSDVFDGFEFYEDKKGVLNFKLMESYGVDKNKLEKEFIIPDFFVHRIKVEEFKELLKNRSYMMGFGGKITENVKYISIIGEIKSSHHQAHKNTSQKRDYISFIKNANLIDEQLLLMYIYDESYKLFKKDINEKREENIILCYIPKLYADECYNAFNNIIVELKSNVNKIDLKNIPKKKIIKI